MPLRLDITKKLYARSDRVKAVDFHPTEPWVLACLYNGQALIWNFETQTLLKTFEVSELPVRTGCFIARKNWIVVGADDMHIRVFNYNTLEKVTTFEGHMDYIRSIAVHPTLPIVLSSSDDMTIRAWDWEKGWRNFQTFEGHSHYVMQVVFNPRDPSTFASASLDRTIKVWQIGAAVPNFTLEGHERGVNCLDFYPGSDRPLLISGADDMQIKVWDLHSKSPIQTLRGHTQNLSVVTFHPTLPLIISGSEDGTVRLWHSHTFRLENTLSYGLERVWAIATRPGNNDVAIGFDEGTVVLKFHLAEKALMRAGDLPGLLMYYNACGNEEGLRKVARLAEEAESTNVAFAANWVTHNLVDCAQILLDTGREAEAAMLARTYRPDLVDHCLDHWKSVLSITHPRVAGSLARPDAVAFGSANAAPPAGHLSSRGDRQAETPSLDTETLSIRSTESGSSSTAHSPTLEDMPRSGGVSPTADLASYSRQAQPLDGGFSASGAGSPGMPGAGAATPLTTGLEDRLAALPMVAPPPAAGEARAPFAMPTFASGGSGAVAASSSSSPSSPGLSRGGSPGGGSPLVTAAQPPGTSSSPLFTGLQPSASPSSASPFGVAAGSPVAPGPGSPGNRSPAAPAAQWSNPASPFSTTDDFDF
ncbi:hypothetical protein H696_02096 [Fonticula alba]|uniref:Beta'-coat protein n=1 Tax=Fonticula alba TaxID=691883 RepID=A0A058ZB37_FONAL|nr:hypothetical protein H696_02096 [Fonticula alba]KCV71146.1 hypothetical protein H696_02096 [Fonticula alba]|eukprot:XP_009494269.1 hypothetical protein H696_02096 [Fonticula alba]